MHQDKLLLCNFSVPAPPPPPPARNHTNARTVIAALHPVIAHARTHVITIVNRFIREQKVCTGHEPRRNSCPSCAALLGTCALGIVQGELLTVLLGVHFQP